MLHIRAEVFVSFALIFISCSGSAAAAEGRRIYFRSEGGVAGLETGSIPDRLDSPDTLRWRTLLVLLEQALGGRIFRRRGWSSPWSLSLRSTSARDR